MGTLYLVATPIGNLEDITLRALRILYAVDTIACEDTRQTSRLLVLLRERFASVFSALSIPPAEPRLVRYDNETEYANAPEIVALLEEGKDVALVSDAGTPLISDPGYYLVSESRKRGISVESIPGPSALLTALAASGLPADRFTFLGYPPEKAAHRSKLFAGLGVPSGVKTTYILYCAPHKLRTTLEDLKTGLGDITVVICRELTKIHEEFYRGSITHALEAYREPKGEFVLLFRVE